MSQKVYSGEEVSDKCAMVAILTLIILVVIFVIVFAVAMNVKRNNWHHEATEAGVGYFDKDSGQFKFHILTIEEQKEKFTELINNLPDVEIEPSGAVSAQADEQEDKSIVLTPEEHAKLFEYILEQRNKEASVEDGD